MNSGNSGITLIELMVVIAVLGIITAVAVPAYNNYIKTARISIIKDTMQSIYLFQEERRMDRGEYVSGKYDPAAPDMGLAAALGWRPDTGSSMITFDVVCDINGESPPECARGSGFTITGTHPEEVDPVERTFP